VPISLPLVAVLPSTLSGSISSNKKRQISQASDSSSERLISSPSMAKFYGALDKIVI
jgi:hypothetical protein